MLWFCCALLGLDSPKAAAQSVEEFPLRDGMVSAPGKAPENVGYRATDPGESGFNRSIGSVSVPTVTVFRPATPAHGGAALIVCPGGGYERLVIDREGFAVGRYFQQRGITVMVLKYRLPEPEVVAADLPLSQQDALAAVQFVRHHAVEWGINPRRIGVMGFSAGGHLAGSAAMLGDARADSRPDFAALIYPVVYMTGSQVHEDSRLHLLGPAPTAERAAAFSLEQNVRPDLPPFFLAHAQDDRLVPVENSVLLEAALQRVGVPVEFVRLPSGGHGFALRPNRAAAIWPGQFLRWLDNLP